MASKITYTDKEQNQASAVETKKKWRFEDANEVKDVVNDHADNIEFLETLSIQLEKLLEGKTFTDLNPDGTDNPLQISFGAAQNGPTDPVQLDADGTVTFNDAGVYLIGFTGGFGRSGASGTSELRVRAQFNLVPNDPVLAIKLNNSSDRIPFFLALSRRVEAGDTLKVFVLRDSTGNDSGGLLSAVTTFAGWSDAPSSGILVQRLRNN